jgi:hypothetical protein
MPKCVKSNLPSKPLQIATPISSMLGKHRVYMIIVNKILLINHHTPLSKGSGFGTAGYHKTFHRRDKVTIFHQVLARHLPSTHSLHLLPIQCLHLGILRCNLYNLARH